MSTLTKICVVLLAVLVLFASVVFIHKAVGDKNWKDLALQQSRRATFAEAEAASQQMAASMWEQYYRQEKKEVEKVAAALQQLRQDKRVEIENLTIDRVETQARMNDLSAQFTVAQNTINSQAEQIKTLDGNLRAQRQENITLADQNRRQEDAIKDLQAKLEIAERSARELQQQLAVKDAQMKDMAAKMEQMDDEIRRLRALLGESPGTTAVREPVGPTTKLDATITAVQGDLASLNIGTASGVTKGMVFIVYRGADFVAHLRIAEVFASSSAGVIYDAQRDVKQGDKAATSLE